MRFITVSVGTHGVETTVSEMRKRLAHMLSGLNGDQKVFFNFVMHIEPRGIDAPAEARHNSMPSALGAPYSLASSGLWGYAQSLAEGETVGVKFAPGTVVQQGELARPENE